ncbi:MAG: helix-turn-helix transcriptional regulator [Clostridia bacterium]|nr:helix-turn-helix transcriptional regulator [Clostridia bacterium]
MTELEMITSRLREAISDSGFSLAQISAMTDIPKSTLQRWTSGQIKKIPIDEIVIIADAIGVSSKWIMGWQKEKAPAVIVDNERTAEVVELFSRLSPEHQALIIAQIKGILSSQ